MPRGKTYLAVIKGQWGRGLLGNPFSRVGNVEESVQMLRSIRHGRPQAAESETKVQCGVGKWLRLDDRAKFEDESSKGQVSVEYRV